MWIGGSNEDPKIFPEGLVIIMCQFVGFRTSSASVVYLLDKIRIVSLSSFLSIGCPWLTHLCYARPAIFKSSPNGWVTGPEGTTLHNSDEDRDEDDDMPPLEANTNRNRPFDVHSDTESDSDSWTGRRLGNSTSWTMSPYGYRPPVHHTWCIYARRIWARHDKLTAQSVKDIVSAFCLTLSGRACWGLSPVV